MFLTDTQLRQLTGAQRKSHQVAWLRANGWPFEITRTGHPRVATDYFRSRLVEPAVPSTQYQEPNFGALTA